LAGADAKTAFDANGLLDNLKKALAERVLNAEMDHHLAGEDSSNSRNGYGDCLKIGGEVAESVVSRLISDRG
jgi:transposase-like protein